MAAAAGLVLAGDRLAVAPFLEDLPPASPLRSASDDVILCLASEGHAYIEFLVDEAEAHLQDGLPMTQLHRGWASEKVRAAKAKARAVKAADRAITPPPSITIARVEAARESLAEEVEILRNENASLRADLEALQALAAAKGVLV
jgi:hypothetical protein